ncbi:cyclic nucleotide-binding protein [Leptolinea sp. HRD-7]|jgi:CRP-like cAMP-binding protein|nr:cyclic nucleotide-binding protein [Leptolinea sp. HRD-7]
MDRIVRECPLAELAEAPSMGHNLTMFYQLPIFENLCPSWEKVLHLGTREIFAKGSRIFFTPDNVDGLYYIMDGSIEINLHTVHGPEKVLFIEGKGCIFGEVSCFVGGDAEEASARTRSDTTLYYFKKETIEKVIAPQYPGQMIELVQILAYKSRMFSDLLTDELISNEFTRVCKMLVYLVRFKEVKIESGQNRVTFVPDMTQLDIARLMGVHRVTVTKAVSDLKRRGIIRQFTRKCLDITNFPELLNLVEAIDR